MYLDGNQLIGLGFVSEEQRRELFEKRMEAVTKILDTYQSMHLSSMNQDQVQEAVNILAQQQDVIITAADEEQLVDTPQEQEQLAMLLARLVKVITIYEDHLIFLGDYQTLGAPTRSDLPDMPEFKEESNEEAPLDSAYDSPDKQKSFGNGLAETLGETWHNGEVNLELETPVETTPDFVYQEEYVKVKVELATMNDNAIQSELVEKNQASLIKPQIDELDPARIPVVVAEIEGLGSVKSDSVV